MRDALKQKIVLKNCIKAAIYQAESYLIKHPTSLPDLAVVMFFMISSDNEFGEKFFRDAVKVLKHILCGNNY